MPFTEYTTVSPEIPRIPGRQNKWTRNRKPGRKPFDVPKKRSEYVKSDANRRSDYVSMDITDSSSACSTVETCCSTWMCCAFISSGYSEH